MTDTTAGLVCSHHHLYSALARGMPAPPQQPHTFLQILEQIWWRLDAALDLEMLRWSAMLGALEALECGTTAIVDHHESPNCIEGSLSTLADACAEVGVRFVGAYGVTDRWSDSGVLVSEPPVRMTSAARRGLAECERFVKEGGRGMVGVHASFTCSDSTLEAAAGLARDLGVGVHIHVAEGPDDAAAASRLSRLAADDWLLVHCVHLADHLPGTIAHNPRSNMNNAVGYASPARFNATNPVVLGTDGIGADMLDEFRVAYARLRESDVDETPDTPWKWLTNGYALVPDAAHDTVRWSYPSMEPWHLAFTTGVRALDVVIDGQSVLTNGVATRVDSAEIRAKAAEQAQRLFARL